MANATLGQLVRLRKWRTPKLVLVLMALEFPITVALLALFGIAAPNLYRTRLWQDGADNGFNSSPKTILYAMANYRPATVPLVWSQFITNFNLVIIILSMFLLLLKSTLFFMHSLYPSLALVIHLILVALYGFSVHGQSASEHLDPKHQVNRPPWYITKSCNVTSNKSNTGYCQQAKSSFLATVLILALFSLFAVLALWSLVAFVKDGPKKSSSSDMPPKSAASTYLSADEKSAISHYPMSPGTTGGLKSPVTPRTRNVNAMEDGSYDLPLRNFSHV